jgi:hypothetical protein
MSISSMGTAGERRNGDADRIGGVAPLLAAERRHQQAVLDVDEMDRHQAGVGGLLAPFADPPDMGGMAQRHDRHPGLLGLGDADLDGLRGDGLAEAVVAFQHGMGRALGNHRDRQARDGASGPHVLDIARRPDDAVAVVAGEVGIHQVAGDALGLGVVTADLDEYGGDEIAQYGDGNGVGR